MEQITLKANINECTVENWQSNAGEFNARVINVEMCEDLRSCDKQFVTFELEDKTVYESLVVDGKAELPFIEKPQFVKIGLYAEDTQGDKCEKRFSSKPAYEYINMGSYTDNVSDNVKPTPGDYAELLKKIEGVDGSGGVVDQIFDPESKNAQSGIAVAEALKNLSNNDELITAERIADDTITVDKVAYNFFRDGLKFNKDGGDIEFFGAIMPPSKSVILTGFLRNKATDITQDATDEAIPTAKAVVDYAVAKNDVVTEFEGTDVDYEENQVYNANVLNCVLSEMTGMLVGFASVEYVNELIGGIENGSY